MLIAMVLCGARGVGAAEGGGVIRVGVVALRDPAEKADAEQDALRAGLPTELVGRAVEPHVCRVGRDDPELEAYRVVVLLSEWAGMLPQLDAHAEAFHRYVKRGGGLVVFQPNPMAVYPPGARPPEALRGHDIRPEHCTPKLLPLRATFYNWYVKGEGVAVARPDHPIVAGLTGCDMPFASDRVFDVHADWCVLARGEQNGSASLAAARWGDGRIVLLPDSLTGNQASGRVAPATVIRRALLWAAGASDEDVKAVQPPPSARWPTEDYLAAVRDGTLQLEIVWSVERIATFEGLHLRLRLGNAGDKPVRVPGNWSALLGAEVVPIAEGGEAEALTWSPDLTEAARRQLWTVAPGSSSGQLTTRHWFPCRRLTGRPDESPYLPPGRYRFRLYLADPRTLRTGWRTLEVGQPGADERTRALAARRPDGRVLLVDARRTCPEPDGSIERPYSHLAEALQAAKAGDAVYCGPGRHNTAPAVVPDGVLLAGAGAANTVVVVSACGAKCPGVRAEGACRIEDLTLTHGDTVTKGLLCVDARGARPELVRCVLMPNAAASGEVSETVLVRDASPAFRNCIIVSRVGSYAALVRGGARPVFEYCTIVSCGFGVGIMDDGTATLRRCIVAGQCPGILAQVPCEYVVRESVLWCRGGGATFRYPITRWRLATEGQAPSARTIAECDEATLKRPDVHCFDPKIRSGSDLATFLTVRNGSDAAAYGAYAGPDARSPAATPQAPTGIRLPDLRSYLGDPQQPAAAVRESAGGTPRRR